jgi:photosystem II stability/assembly factor-like uncharacterized protein
MRAIPVFAAVLPAVLGTMLWMSPPVFAQTWRSMGPPGGDVRSFGHDPRHPGQLYLGTADGHLFGSEDAGDHWHLVGRVGPRLDSVVTAILVDPRESRRLFAATWTRDSSTGGGVFRSDDAGQSWRPAGLAGQSVRALVQAPSDPDRLVAGTLEGVFGSKDGGQTWQRLSPAADNELHNLDSVAVDPRHPEVLYAGTFHLPWKSSDDGKTWNSIHTGMIDDSDVMSILVDRSDGQRIYASSCSGIYRSENGGELWAKIQGIPFSARRTPVILQDPADPAIIYAGTTEGLWKSQNGGTLWRRITSADWVVNALELPSDHRGRVVLGTEQLGVMVSDDGGEHFREANDGFDHRQIFAVAFDPGHSGRILAVLANAPEPVLATEDGGGSWAPLGPGLTMRSLKRIFASPDGWWATLTEGGLSRYDAQRRSWARAGTLDAAATAKPPSPSGKLDPSDKSAARKAARGERALNLVVNDMAFAETRWFAATEKGLLLSGDRGAHWKQLPLGPLPDLPVASVRASADARSLWVVSLRGLVFSSDGGRNWTWHDLPLGSGGALRLELGPGQRERQTLVAVAHNGLFISRDAGDTWRQAAAGLPSAPVEDFAVAGEMFVASPQVGGLYVSTDAGRTWARITGTLAEGFFPVIAADAAASTVVAASATDGLYSIHLGPDPLAAPEGVVQ